jgi:TPR repeat protein
VRGPLPSLVLIGVLASVGCSDRGEQATQSSTEDPDRRARDRARAMVDNGRACDDSDPDHRDLAACRRGCSLGHSNSCGWLGDAYARGAGVPRDTAKALAHYRESCRGGSGLGCEGLARFLADGIGVDRDPDAAEARYREARTVYRVHCGQRHAASCLRLGDLYARGLGGRADRATAITYWQRACALGAGEACDRE